jgi:hypothetical protein
MAAARVRHEPESLIMAQTVQNVENYTETLLWQLNNLTTATTIEQDNEGGVSAVGRSLGLMIATLTTAREELFLFRPGLGTVIPGGIVIDLERVQAEDIARHAMIYTTAYCEVMAWVLSTVLGLEDDGFKRYITSILRMIDRVAEAHVLLFGGPRLDINPDLVHPFLA